MHATFKMLLSAVRDWLRLSPQRCGCLKNFPLVPCQTRKCSRAYRAPVQCPLTFGALLIALCAPALPLAAQQPAQPVVAELSDATTGEDPNIALAYLRFVNATGADGPLMVRLDGQVINPSGYKDGQATGAVGFPEKTSQIELEHPVLGEAKTGVSLKPGMVTAVIALPKTEPPAKAGEEPKVKLDVFVLESAVTEKGKTPTLTLLQTAAVETLNLSVAGRPVSLGRLKPDTLEVTNGMGDFPAIEIANQKICTLNYTDRADQVVVLFTNQKGVLKHVNFHNAVR